MKILDGDFTKRKQSNGKPEVKPEISFIGMLKLRTVSNVMHRSIAGRGGEGRGGVVGRRGEVRKVPQVMLTM